MPEIRPKDRSNDTTPFSLSSTNVYESANVESGLAARIESSGTRESSGGRNAREHSGRRDSDSKVSFGRSCIDGSVAAEELQNPRSARRLCRGVPVQRPRDRAGVQEQRALG